MNITISENCTYDALESLCHKCADYEPFFDDNAETVTYFCAYDNDILCGFISCLVPNDSSPIEITACVSPEYRKKGIFTKMFMRLKKYLNTNFPGNNFQYICCPDISLINTSITKKSKISLHFSHKEYLMAYDTDCLNFNKDQNNNTLNNLNSKFPESECYFSDDLSCYMFFSNSEDTYSDELSDEPLGVLELEYFQTHTCISSVYVDEDKRGLGIGTFLMLSLIYDYFIVQKKTEPLYLHVSGKNIRALSLYNHVGFKEIDNISYYFLSCSDNI